MHELAAAIERVAAGGTYVDPRLDRILLVAARDRARARSSRRASARSCT